MELFIKNQITNETISYDVLSKRSSGLYNRIFKRIIDVFFALILLICLLPLFLVVGISIIIDTGFPVFYKSIRSGYNNKPFNIYKFRSMVKNADQIGGGTTGFNDARITKIGYVLRKSKLDEIVQLINIIKGDMSFVGVRPELMKYTLQYTGDEKIILQVRPGITDYSSLKFINLDELVGSEQPDLVYETTILPIKNKLRIKYATEVSLFVDIKILTLTIFKVIKKVFSLLSKK